MYCENRMGWDAGEDQWVGALEDKKEGDYVGRDG